MRSAVASLAFALLASTHALAADPGVILSPDIAPERFGWTGFYAGATGGYAWMSDIDYSFAPPLRSSGEDWVYGVYAGYLHQFGNFVVGAEGEFLNLDIQFEGLPVFAEESYSVRARGGYAFDDFLVTGHAGMSYVTTNIGLEDWAWTVGLGLDYAVTDNIVVGASYSHMWSDSYDDTLIDAKIDTLTARLGIKF